jgi:hypothetical protein
MLISYISHQNNSPQINVAWTRTLSLSPDLTSCPDRCPLFFLFQVVVTRGGILIKIAKKKIKA